MNPKTKTGRKLKSLPYEEAKRWMRLYCPAKSQVQYWRWHDEHAPHFIPKMPNRAYKDEWEGWNSYLGTQNSFGPITGDYMTFWDAVRFVQPLELQSQKEWLEYARESGNKPDEIPIHPDHYYDDWRGWDVWLGKTIHGKIKSQQEMKEEVQGVLALVHRPEDPPNVLMVSIVKEGMAALLEKQQKFDFQVVKVFQYEEDLMPSVNNLINLFSTAYEGDNKIRLVPNINELLWQLGSILLFAKP